MMRVEIRADCVVVEGYVNAVGRDSRPIPSPHGRFIEQVKPGTFKKSLMRNPKVELRFNHRRILGSTETGELTLEEDAIGLRARARVTDAEVMTKARNKELRGWSFGFYTNTDRWEDTDSGMQRRSLEDIDMTEVSILDVTPAYIATSIEQRGEEENAVEMRSSPDAAEIYDLTDKGGEPPPEGKIDLLSVKRREIELLKIKRR